MCGRPLGRKGFQRAALGRVQSCVRPFVAALPLALMKSADRLPDHSNGLEAL
jgi:hypothetical protein